jgi:hypothetical protein
MMHPMLLTGLWILLSAGVAWAAGYELLMSGDEQICRQIGDRLHVRQDGSTEFGSDDKVMHAVTWQPVSLGGDAPKSTVCSELQQARLDLNNDGSQDLVIRSRFCMKGKPSDSLYVFPEDSAVLQQATWQDLNPLHATQDKFERTGGRYRLQEGIAGRGSAELRNLFTIEPFVLDGRTYVSLTSPPYEYVVIASYQDGGSFRDLCYLRRQR